MTRTRRALVISGALLVVPGLVVIHALVEGIATLRDADAAARATFLARTISEAMNCLAIAAPIVGLFLLIGLVLWAKRRRVERTRSDPPAPAGRDTSWHPPS